MKIPKNMDVVSKEAPAYNKGTNFFDNPQIEPHTSAIPDSPGEKAMNDTAAHSQTSKQPFGKGGTGYGGY